MKRTVAIITALLLCVALVSAEPLGDDRRNALVTDLTLPLFGAVVVDANIRLTRCSELVTGFWYSDTEQTGSIVGSVAYPGRVESYAGVFGFRRYVWRGFHLEYQLLPGLSRYHGDDGTEADGFTLFNEFRFGYNIDTTIFSVPVRINFQFPLGFELFSTNKPDSFQAADDRDPLFFIFIPNPYIGIRF